MKKLFQTWLFVFVAAAFLVTITVSWAIHSKLARISALELLAANLDDAAKRVELSKANLSDVIAVSNESAVAKVRALAMLVAADPELLRDHRRLDHVRRMLAVDEVHVSDEKGILIASVTDGSDGTDNYLGYDMGSAEQSAEFLGAITDPDFTLVQEVRPKGISNEPFQYIGTARLDSPGIVQIGYRPERVARAMRVADISDIAANFRIGRSGILMIAADDGSFPDGEKAEMREIDGRTHLCLSRKYAGWVLTATLPEEEMYLSRDLVIRFLVIGNVVLFAVIFFLISVLLQKVVIKGIYSVNASLAEITGGNLDEKVSVSTTGEFTALSDGINSTVDALKHAIDEEARRLDAELEMGRIIQTSTLPVNFPDNETVALAAKMFTAREVGGDFYDFFPLSGDRIAAIIADVSGKGITAALFMMTAKTLLKEMVMTVEAPERAFEAANRELCRNNTACMFLTAFMAVIDLRTGEAVCVNAGHNPPVRKHPDGGCELLRLRHSVALGVSPKAEYAAEKMTLTAGELLFLYTDGVTEAVNASGELFGEKRLLELLAGVSGSPGEIIAAAKAGVDAFSGGTSLSDDITMLALEFRAPRGV